MKGLSRRTLARLRETRETHGGFASLGDFLDRVPATRREAESLILGGAFDALTEDPRRPSHPRLLWELACRREGRKLWGSAIPGLELGPPPAPPLDPYDRWTTAIHELRHLGMAVREHPLSILRPLLAARGMVPVSEASRGSGAKVQVAGLVAAQRDVATRSGELMRFLTIEDETGIIEGALPPAVLAAWPAGGHHAGPYLLTARVRSQSGWVDLAVKRVEFLRLAAFPGVREALLRV